MRLSPQQDHALLAVSEWHRNALWQAETKGQMDQQVFRVFGYAGTGKTTIARRFADDLSGDTVYAAYTGKAALQMQRSGCREASTIHSLIYEVKELPDGRIVFRRNIESAAKAASMIVIDECSMVDKDVGEDLLAYRRPILVLGDPAQLPPVKGAGFFTSAAPDVMLTEIHRQAAGNPIIQLATAAREGRALTVGDYGHSRIVERGRLSWRDVASADQVLVGKNVTRRSFNRRLRGLAGRDHVFPEAGDRLVCLRNDKTCGIFNGGLFTVCDRARLIDGLVEMTVVSDDFQNRPPIEVKVRPEFFAGGADDIPWQDLRGTQQFDYGYALTCHKAQGSQWPHVVAYDESGTFRDDARRWLYTAITRASDRLTLVV